MTTIELIRFTITVFIGGASISLAIFSFLASMRNNKQSKEALDKIKDLTSEIKSNLNTSLSNQKDYTGKMLDTIISKSSYISSSENGVEHRVDEEIVNELVEIKIDQIEKNLNGVLESKISELGNNTSAEVLSVINQLGLSLTKEEIYKAKNKNSTDDLPIDIKEQLVYYKQAPALLLLLAILVKEKPNMMSIEAIMNNYSMPDGWEGGLEKLEEDGLIVQEKGGIIIPKGHKESLELWAENNWRRVLQLRAIYKKRNKGDGSERGIVSIHQQLQEVASNFNF